MQVIALYRPQSEHERIVLDFKRDFHMRTGKEIELLSLDTVEGAQKARTYDIVRYPALMAVDESGVLQKLWEGGSMPMINEVSYYTSTLGSGTF